MAESSGGIFEMLWDCGFCGTGQLLGKTNRYCPSCGAPQDETKRYFPPPGKEVAANTAYQNAKQNSDKENARIEHDKALGTVIVGLMKDDTELFKQFSDNPEFKRWLTDTIFAATYDRPAASAP